MQLQFLGQPYRVKDQVGPAIAAAVQQDWSAYVWIATAWVRHSGLARICGQLESFRSKGGCLELVVGIDGGGTTQQGLDLALELFDNVYLFHDHGPRTYHPKIYVVEGDSQARVFVGSGNLSHDGLFTNYEANILIEVDKSNSEDDRFLKSVRDYYQKLKTSPACTKIDEALLVKLSRRGRIVDESASHRSEAGPQNGEGVRDSADLIGASIEGLAGAPEKQRDLDELEGPRKDGQEGSTEFADGESGEDQAGRPAPEKRRFYKALSANDVSPDSSPGQIVIPIRFRDFFEPLKVQKDESSQGGVRQSDHVFSVRFRDRVSDNFTKLVDSARAVLYEPAEEHPRPNDELRFTFRDQEIFERLSEDEFLTFQQGEGGRIVVERHAANSFPNRYDWM